MWNARLGESQAEIKISGRDTNNHSHVDDRTLKAESKEELKSHLMMMKQENEKAGLKLNIQKSKIITSSPITSWQIDGETMETQFLQMVTTAMGLKDVCSLEEKLWQTKTAY